MFPTTVNSGLVLKSSGDLTGTPLANHSKLNHRITVVAMTPPPKKTKQKSKKPKL